MPRSGRKKVLKIQFKRLEAKEEVSQEHASIPLKAKGVNDIRSSFPPFGDSNRPKQPPSLFRKVFDNKSDRVKMVGGVPPKSKLNLFWGKLLKPRNVSLKKLPTRNSPFLNKKVSKPSMVTRTLMQKELVAPRFLSILIGKGRLIRRRVTAQLSGRKGWWNNEENKRLPHAKRLLLFQALRKEPLPFLDVHVRFGVSKQTVRRLVNNGLLMEEWGPKAIGVRFKLSKKGKMYLKKLEAAAKYESKVGEKEFIRLKHKPLF